MVREIETCFEKKKKRGNILHDDDADADDNKDTHEPTESSARDKTCVTAGKQHHDVCNNPMMMSRCFRWGCILRCRVERELVGKTCQAHMFV